MISPARRWLLDAEEDAAVFRDVATMRAVARLDRHVAQVEIVALSPDG